MARIANNFFKMEMLLLKIIKDGDCYGYQIVQSLKRFSGGNINIAEGTMYPILYRLLDKGFIKDEKRLVGLRQTRVYYKIQPEGEIYLEQLYQDYLKMTACIEVIMEGNHGEEQILK